MKAIKLTTEESEAVERAYYEASSFEALMAVLCRQLNADANPETAKVIRHYAELCRAAQMKLKMVQEMVLSRYLDHQNGELRIMETWSKDCTRAILRPRTASVAGTLRSK